MKVKAAHFHTTIKAPGLPARRATTEAEHGLTWEPEHRLLRIEVGPKNRHEEARIYRIPAERIEYLVFVDEPEAGPKNRGRARKTSRKEDPAKSE